MKISTCLLAGTLPLKRGTKVALLGPHLNSSIELLANYYGENIRVADSTPLAAFLRRAAAGDVTVGGFAEGCKLAGNDTSGFPAAVTAAAQADVAVVFAGLRSTQVNMFNFVS